MGETDPETTEAPQPDAPAEDAPAEEEGTGNSEAVPEEDETPADEPMT